MTKWARELIKEIADHDRELEAKHLYRRLRETLGRRPEVPEFADALRADDWSEEELRWLGARIGAALAEVRQSESET